MSELKHGGLDQYGAEPFKQQPFGTAGVKMINNRNSHGCQRHAVFTSRNTQHTQSLAEVAV